MKHFYAAFKLLLICLNLLFIRQPLQAQGCWKYIAKGSTASHTVAIAQDGSLWAWGYNLYLQLGTTASVNQSNSPVKIGTATNWLTVTVGACHTMAIKTDGTLWGWGLNSLGQLGDGAVNPSTAGPLQIGTASNWLTVSAGVYYTTAIKTDGSLWAWGVNNNGQLGDGTNINKNIPVKIGTATNWQTVVAGNFYTIATKTDGSLWAWGANNYGQLGDGTTAQKNGPVQIGTATDWFRVTAGGGHTIATKTDGSLWAWGYNAYGQLGDGTTTQKNSPVQIGTDTGWLTIIAGGVYSIATKANGSLWAWGYNGAGQLGDGTVTQRNSPVQIGSANNWKNVTAAGHTIATKTDGSLWAWGDNYYGQLGDGTTVGKNIPTAIACPAAVVLPVTYTYFTAAKQGSNVLLKWQTANEVNNSYFTIQHSTNGSRWASIGTVNAGDRNYSFVHTTAATGTNYYRLRQVDKDGKNSLSEVQIVNLDKRNTALSVYPNPMTGNNFVVNTAKEIIQPLTYTLYNTMGIQVQRGTISQMQQTIAIGNLAKGAYLLRLSDGQSTSLVKQ